MYCTCSNKNNYEVISLCDIKKFSDKNSPFNNKSWTQISIADILILDCNKHTIEKIEKIYITTSITNTKIIETPISPAPNLEGMTLTGKKLLVDGFICSKIVYTSLTREQSVYTSNFNVPFCTYIVIEPNADPFNDKYCIKTCIEDVFLSLVDCKTIFQNVTLFLLAEKTFLTCPNPQIPKEDCTITNVNPPNPPPSNTIANNIILNDLNNNPVITISFDKVNMKILATSTGRTTDTTGGADYFKFTLYQSDGITEKITNTIGGNSNGMNFSNDVSNTNFQVGDIITLQAKSSNKVIITNFPDSNTPIYTPTGNGVSFKISANGLVPYTPTYTIPNEVIFVTGSNTFIEIAKISFNNSNNTLTVTSTNEQFSNSNARAIILFKLRDGNNLNNIKVHSLIAYNKIASKFVTDLNNSNFSLNDLIEITTYTNGISKITNFPNSGQTYFIDDGKTTDHTITEFFKITSTGLQSITPSPVPATAQLPNIINVKSNFAPNLIMFSILFNALDKVFSIKLNGSFSLKSKYLIIKLIDTNGNTVIEAVFDGGTAVNSYNLANIIFEFGYILELTYLDGYKDFIEISNFPNQGQTHIPTSDKESFRITPTGLVPYTPPVPTLKNQITIKKTDNSTFGTISFDITNKKVLLNGFTGEYNSSGDSYNVLNFRLYTANSSRTKDITLNSLSDSATFKSELNGASFDINSVLELAYDNRSKASINVTNFPNDNTTHTPTVTREYYKITADGLVVHTPLPYTINCLKSDGSVSFYFNLDMVEKVISCTIVNRNPSIDDSGLALKINGNFSAELDSHTPNDLSGFIYPAQGGKFEYTNSSIEFYIKNNPIELVDYPTKGINYRLPKRIHNTTLQITINGIVGV